EDDDDTREMIRAMLELCGATVLVAESAKSGLEVFLRSRPDAIVSDIAMPGEDGYWLVREVARTLNARDVPAVAVTAFAGQPPRLRCRRRRSARTLPRASPDTRSRSSRRLRRGPALEGSRWRCCRRAR